MRAFAGIDLGREPVPDATTILKFRHLLEKHDLGQAIFAEVGRILQQRGLKLSAGTIVDATIIAAPSCSFSTRCFHQIQGEWREASGWWLSEAGGSCNDASKVQARRCDALRWDSGTHRPTHAAASG